MATWILMAGMVLFAPRVQAANEWKARPATLSFMNAGTAEWTSREIELVNPTSQEALLESVRFETDQKFEVERKKCDRVGAKEACKLQVRYYAPRAIQFQTLMVVKWVHANGESLEAKVPVQVRAQGYCQHRAVETSR